MLHSSQVVKLNNPFLIGKVGVRNCPHPFKGEKMKKTSWNEKEHTDVVGLNENIVRLRLINEICYYNVVTCGECGEILIHHASIENIECGFCGFESEPCDFPDLIH